MYSDPDLTPEKIADLITENIHENNGLLNSYGSTIFSSEISNNTLKFSELSKKVKEIQESKVRIDLQRYDRGFDFSPTLAEEKRNELNKLDLMIQDRKRFLSNTPLTEQKTEPVRSIPNNMRIQGSSPVENVVINKPRKLILD